jgi:hypothetical protein
VKYKYSIGEVLAPNFHPNALATGSNKNTEAKAI